MIFKTLGKTAVEISAIGQGSMSIGGQFSPDYSHDSEQVAALRLGIEKGMTFLDTAEIYGGGHAEEIIGEAVKGIRGRVFIATKFSPEHNDYASVMMAVEKSLSRLKTDYIDLYQVHWPNPEVPITETMRALEDLMSLDKIRHIGVSNFSLRQLKEARQALEKTDIVSNQVEYNLFDRSIEKDLLPHCEDEGISVIAYSPLDQGKIIKGIQGGVIEEIANRYKKTVSQIILNWLASHKPIISIPKALKENHILENAAALDFEMTREDVELISQTFRRECLSVPVGRINVSAQGEGARKVYQTLEEAVRNRLNLCPSPAVLAHYIRAHPDEDIKPVRLAESIAKTNGCDYDLVEGRVRYWAWVIAFDGKRPVPAYVRE